MPHNWKRQKTYPTKANCRKLYLCFTCAESIPCALFCVALTKDFCFGTFEKLFGHGLHKFRKGLWNVHKTFRNSPFPQVKEGQKTFFGVLFFFPGTNLLCHTLKERVCRTSSSSITPISKMCCKCAKNNCFPYVKEAQKTLFGVPFLELIYWPHFERKSMSDIDFVDCANFENVWEMCQKRLKNIRFPNGKGRSENTFWRPFPRTNLLTALWKKKHVGHRFRRLRQFRKCVRNVPKMSEKQPFSQRQGKVRKHFLVSVYSN